MGQEENTPPLESILDGSGVRYYSRRTRKLTPLEKKLEVAREAFHAARRSAGLPEAPRLQPGCGSSGLVSRAVAAAGRSVSSPALRRELIRRAREAGQAEDADLGFGFEEPTAPALHAAAAAAAAGGIGAAAAISMRSSPQATPAAAAAGGGGGISAPGTASSSAGPDTSSAGAAGAAASSAPAPPPPRSLEFRSFADPLGGSERGPVVPARPYHTEARTFFNLSLLPTSVAGLQADSNLYYAPAGSNVPSTGGPRRGLRDGMIRYYQPNLAVDNAERQRLADAEMAERLARSQEALQEHIQALVARWGPAFLDRILAAEALPPEDDSLVAEATQRGRLLPRASRSSGSSGAAGGGAAAGAHAYGSRGSQPSGASQHASYGNMHKLRLSVGGLDAPVTSADVAAGYDRLTTPRGRRNGSPGGSGGSAGAARVGPVAMERLTFLANKLQVPVEMLIGLVRKHATGGAGGGGGGRTAADGPSGRRGGGVVGVAGARQRRRIEILPLRKPVALQPPGEVTAAGAPDPQAAADAADGAASEDSAAAMAGGGGALRPASRRGMLGSPSHHNLVHWQTFSRDRSNAAAAAPEVEAEASFAAALPGAGAQQETRSRTPSPPLRPPKPLRESDWTKRLRVAVAAADEVEAAEAAQAAAHRRHTVESEQDDADGASTGRSSRRSRGGGSGPSSPPRTPQHAIGGGFDSTLTTPRATPSTPGGGDGTDASDRGSPAEAGGGYGPSHAGTPRSTASRGTNLRRGTSALFLSRRLRARSIPPTPTTPRTAAAAAAAIIEGGGPDGDGGGTTLSYHHPSGLTFVDLGTGVPHGPSLDGLQPVDPAILAAEAASNAAFETLARRHGNRPSLRALRALQAAKALSPRSVAPTAAQSRVGSASPSHRGASGGRRRGAQPAAGGAGPGSRSRPVSRPASRPGSRQTSRPASRATSVRGNGAGGPSRSRPGTARSVVRLEFPPDPWDSGTQASSGASSSGEEGEGGVPARGRGQGAAGGGGGGGGKARGRSRSRLSYAGSTAASVAGGAERRGSRRPRQQRAAAGGANGSRRLPEVTNAAGQSLGGANGNRRVSSPRSSCSASLAGLLDSDDDDSVMCDSPGAGGGGGGGNARSTRGSTYSVRYGTPEASPTAAAGGGFRSARVSAAGNLLGGPRHVQISNEGSPAGGYGGGQGSAAGADGSPLAPVPLPTWNSAPAASAGSALPRRDGGVVGDAGAPGEGAAGGYGSGAEGTLPAVTPRSSAPGAAPLPRVIGNVPGRQLKRDDTVGLSRHYKLAGARWNPTAPGALRPDYGIRSDYMAGTYNPDLMEAVAAAVQAAEETGEEVRVDYRPPVHAGAAAAAATAASTTASAPGSRPRSSATVAALSRSPSRAPSSRWDGGGGGGAESPPPPSQVSFSGVEGSTAAAPAAPAEPAAGAVAERPGASSAKARAAGAIAEALNPITRAITNVTYMTAAAGLEPPAAVHILVTARGSGGDLTVQAGGGGAKLPPRASQLSQLQRSSVTALAAAPALLRSSSLSPAAVTAAVRHLLPLQRGAAGGLTDPGGGAAAAAAGLKAAAAAAAVSDRIGSRVLRPSQSVWGRADSDEADILLPLRQRLEEAASGSAAAASARRSINLGGTEVKRSDASAAAAAAAAARRAATAPVGQRVAPAAEPRLWRGDPFELKAAFPDSEKVYRMVSDVRASSRLLRAVENDITPLEYRNKLRKGVVM